jgi:RNA polymerase sigma-70 factor (ECF subfamily)
VKHYTRFSLAFTSILIAKEICMSAEHKSFRFPTTQWSLVVAAGDRAAPESLAALAELCEVYWYPLYAFIRCHKYSQADSSDLTQEYVTRLLERPIISAADRTKGRFRAFLKTDCQHFLLDEARRDKVRRKVRGAVSIDFDQAERRYQFEPSDNLTPDQIFDRTWALTLLDRVLRFLAQEYEDSGHSESFGHLKVFLTQGKGAASVSDIAEKLGTTEGAVYTAVHRLKKRYRMILEQEIAATIDDATTVDEEIQRLFDAVRS